MKRNFLYGLLIVGIGLFGVAVASVSAGRAIAANAQLGENCITVYSFVVLGGQHKAFSVCDVNEVPTEPPIETPTPEVSTETPPVETETPVPTETVMVMDTPTDTATEAVTDTPTDTNTPTPTRTNTATPSATVTTGAPSTPFVGAPLCLHGAEADPLHDKSMFHTLWDSAGGCHYDHEHGTSPFTQAVAAVFSGIQEFLGDVQIGSTNPSSPMENTHKHGGFKWDVNLSVPCEIFEGAQWCVTAAAVQYHNFGDYSIEMEAHIHSTNAFIKACNPNNPSDCGLLYTSQFQEYGQRITPYQGIVIPFPGNFAPAYASNFGPYFSIDCDDDIPPVDDRCQSTSAKSVWTSKRTGPVSQPRPLGSTLFTLLFRVRDNYQVIDWNDMVWPFTFKWMCGNTSYNPVGCKFNNSTTKVHEVAGVVPASWDNLAGFDTNPTVGRITAQGFTDKFGTLQPACTVAGGNCFPVKLINMFVGKYGGPLPGAKVSNPDAVSNPSRNIFFCNGVVCSETSPGAVPSGWIMENN